jgi:hypothetical protein
LQLLEQLVTGSEHASLEESACGMPVPVQIERLRRWLERSGHAGCVVVSSDLEGLSEAERAETIDALVAGAPSPFVLVGGRLVCAGSVEVAAVLGALG